MAVVVPIIAAFATGAAGMAAVATGTMLGIASGYAMVAGAVLSGVGAITGKKDLMKVGGILSLAGGIGSIANGMSMAAASEAGKQAAGQAADEAFKEVGEEALQEALNNAAEGAATDMAANGATQQALEQAAKTGAQQTAGNAAQSLTPLAESVGQASTASSAGTGVQQAVNKAGISLGDVGNLTGGEAINMAPVLDVPGVSVSASSSLGDTLSAGWNNLKDFGGKAGQFMKDNKELVKVGGEMLNGAFGPEADMVELRKKQFAQEQSLLDRAYNNLNNPTRLYSQRLQQMRLQGGVT